MGIYPVSSVMCCVELAIHSSEYWLLWWSELDGEDELSHRQEPNAARERYIVSEKAMDGYKAAFRCEE